MKLYLNSVFDNLFHKQVFSSIFVFKTGHHLNQSKMVISGHCSSSSKLYANSHLRTISDSFIMSIN